MSTLPPSFRLPFTLPDDVHPAVRDALRLSYQGVLDLNQAIAALVPKVNANATAVAKVVAAPTVVTTSGGGGSSAFSAGAVNDQTGNTSYALQQRDLGAIVVLNVASTFTLTLNSGITKPFYCVVENFGSASATLVPDIGSVTVNLAASVPLPAGQSALLFWAGPLNWWMTTLPALAPIPLVGTSASLGGSAMTAGQTVTITVAVTGAAITMSVVTSPQTYPGAGFVWDAYVSAAGVVTVALTCVLAGTPTASLYNVRVIQ